MTPGRPRANVSLEVVRGRPSEHVVVACGEETCSQAMHGFAGTKGHQARIQSKWLSENGWGRWLGLVYCPQHLKQLRAFGEAEEGLLRAIDQTRREAKR